MSFKNYLLVSVLSLAGASSAFAVDCNKIRANIPQSPVKGSAWAECREVTRASDGGNYYLLAKKFNKQTGQFKDAGTLFVSLKNNPSKACPIAYSVDDFSEATNPRDAAHVYYKSNGDLWVAYSSPFGDDCHTVRTQKLMDNVVEYKSVNNNYSAVVNAARNKAGLFQAWGANSRDGIGGVVHTSYDVVDFQINSCFSADWQQGKNTKYHEVAVFLQKRDGKVYLVGGESSNIWGIVPENDGTTYAYKTIADYKKLHNACKSIRKH